MAASRDATLAIDHARQGRNGEALKAWRALVRPEVSTCHESESKAVAP